MRRIFLCAACTALLQACTSTGGRSDLSATTQYTPAGLRTDCATAAVVGLRWDAPRAKVAHYEITRDGASLGTTTETYFADTTVAESTHYSYSVTAVPTSNAPARGASTTEIDTPAASPTGDAPYCGSKHIESMSWDWAGGHTEPDGSDLWPVTWGRDKRVYTFFGDGGGFGGDNYRGRASFGIATIAHSPPLRPDSVRNVYGGYNSSHPSTLQGKGGAIIAVGSDFYTLGGLYTEAETAGHTGPVSGSPKRRQLAYSKGNAHSWHAASWTFCSAEDGELRGNFCPLGFVNHGRGNAGAPDGQVYLLGFVNSTAHWNDGEQQTAASTYLARVPKKRVLEADAYQYFAGLDARGRPIWTADQQLMQPIFTDRNASRPGCGGRCNMTSMLGEAVYDRGIRRYIATAQGDYVGQTSFYDAPHPWGPWTTISYNNIDAETGTGGWANLGTTGGESLGVHLVNAWSSPDGLALWATYSSDGKAPPGALFPPAGTPMDSFNLVSVRLSPGPALR
jgi:hypothetical protein